MARREKKVNDKFQSPEQYPYSYCLPQLVKKAKP